jgi:uracil permease
MVVTAICAHYGKKTVALIPFVLGMLAGYILAAVFTGIGYGVNNDYLKVIDFSPITNNFSPVTIKSFFSLPSFLFLMNDSSVPLTWSAVGKAALLFIPVSFVTICEHIGDHKNMSGILQRDLLTDPGLTRTLIGDGVATAISGIVCGAANTTYGENVAVVGVTKVASTKVIALACGISILLGFLSPIMSVTMTIPACVTGGVSLILYGFIAASGVKMLIADRIDFGNTKNIFVASVILVSGIGGLVFKFGGSVASPMVEITSIAVSMLLGIGMNLILKDKKTEPAA